MTFDHAKYRIAAFDLDGTLLNMGELSPLTGGMLERLWKSGVEVVVTTGRSLPTVPQEVRALPFIRYIVSSNGACVTDLLAGETILEAPLERTAAESVLRTARLFGGGCNAHYSDIAVHSLRILQILRRSVPPDVLKTMRRRVSPNFRTVLSVLGYVRRRKARVEKIDCLFERDADFAACWQALSQRDDVQLADGLSNNMEVTARGVSKASGLHALMQRLGASMDSVAAFGDSGNDMQMLQDVGFAVAMGNASDDVKAVADYVAGPVEQDGAAAAIAALYALEV